jgi:hypothetical protein
MVLSPDLFAMSSVAISIPRPRVMMLSKIRRLSDREPAAPHYCGVLSQGRNRLFVAAPQSG